MEWSFNNDMPIYTQIIEQIKHAIVSGQLAPGERLTAVRDLAAEAGVNPNTMQRAMQELERTGLVYTQRSSGRFVTEDLNVISQAKDKIADIKVCEFVRSMKNLGYTVGEIIQLIRSCEEDENGKHI